MTDRTYLRDFANKKTISVSAASLTFEDLDGTEPIDLFNIPADCYLIAATIIVHEGGNSGLIRLIIDNTTVLSPSSTSIGDFRNDISISTGTGSKVTLTPVDTLTQGRFTVIVEYIEYTLKSNNLTRYSEQ